MRSTSARRTGDPTMRTSIVASILIASGAAQAAVARDFRAPSRQAITDRVPTIAVEGGASGEGQNGNRGSGGVGRGGNVVSGRLALFTNSPGGAPRPPAPL